MSDAVDTSGFVRICEELARIAERPFEEVLFPNIARLLETCIRLTRARSAADIARRVSKNATSIEFADGTTISTWKKAGGAEMFLDTSTYAEYQDRWPKGCPSPNLLLGRSWHQMNSPDRHWSNARWARYQSYEAKAQAVIAKQRADLMAARGLAKQSWLQIADALGVPLSAKAFVRSANYQGRQYREGFAREILESGSKIVEMTNANPLVVGKLRGREILERALAARQAAFDHEMKAGVFEDLQARARRYPGVFLEAA